MEKEQTSLLGNLYSLRAGLSVISQEWDKMRESIFIKNGTDFICKLLYAYLYNGCEPSNFESPINENSNNKSIYFNRLIGCFNRTLMLPGRLKLSEKNMTKKNFNLNNSTFNEFNADMGYPQLEAIAKRYGIYLDRYGIDIPYRKQCKNYFDIIFFLWCCTDESLKHFNTVLNAYKESKDKLNTGIKKLTRKKQIQNFDLQIQNLSKFISSIEPLRQKYKTFKENSALSKQSCSTLYEFLQRRYATILDVRDWKHLDLVIYYIETRRAESIKEALLCVDREMQTQRIENAIQQATAQICNTLALGFTVLQQTIENGYRAISAQIANSTAVISSQLAGLTSAVNMNNALRAKANVSSEQLMKDVQALRNYIVR